MNVLTFSALKDFLVEVCLLHELLVELAHFYLVLHANVVFGAGNAYTWLLVKILLKGGVLFERVVVHSGHHLEDKVAHISLVSGTFLVLHLNETCSFRKSTNNYRQFRGMTYPDESRKPWLAESRIQSPYLRRLSSLFIYII